jgi:hypothetical protein
MEKRCWRVKKRHEWDAAVRALQDDGIDVRPERRHVGFLLWVEAEPENWDIVEALISTSAPSAHPA